MFTGWANVLLSQRFLAIVNLEEDLRDGNLLVHLLEILSEQTIVKTKKANTSRIQKLQTITLALDFLDSLGIRTHGISSFGNRRLFISKPAAVKQKNTKAQRIYVSISCFSILIFCFSRNRRRQFENYPRFNVGVGFTLSNSRRRQEYVLLTLFLYLIYFFSIHNLFVSFLVVLVCLKTVFPNDFIKKQQLLFRICSGRKTSIIIVGEESSERS